jgi:hypothetical protein
MKLFNFARKNKGMTFEEWLDYGVSHGFCSGVYCYTHDGPPLTETEVEIYEEGSDPCCASVRLGTEALWEEEAQAWRNF